MDKSLLALFTSRVRLKILGLFVPSPDKLFYVREVERQTGEQINAVRRELASLTKIGFLRQEARGNRVYYQLRPEFLYYPELLRLVGKSTNLGAAILKNKGKLGNLKYVVLAAPFVKGRKAHGNQVDLLIVGKVNLSKIKELVNEAEKGHEHEINYTVMTEDEFIFRKKRNDDFLKKILSQPQVVILGDEDELNK
ncbi:MAG: hypothetical protein FJ044_04820 [Candidatus Cloacimonetes bacterium]|nr:hypothetical protein [Candidatus Cloacimonadota bacterium]